jgi:hypothetical protein
VPISNEIIYSKILAIKPGYYHNNGSGIAIYDEETRRLEACDLLISSTQDLTGFQSVMKLTSKSRKFWEKHVGVSYNPAILCIEYPDRCFVSNDYMENFKSIFMLGVLCVRIETKFSTPNTVRPSPNKWKDNKGKDATEMLVRDKLCAWSNKVLQKSLSTIQKHLHHNVYEAVGLGLWAIENSKENPKGNYLS